MNHSLRSAIQIMALLLSAACAGAAIAEDSSDQNLVGKVTPQAAGVRVEYDFRHATQTMDFENARQTATITLSGPSGQMKLDEYQETGRMTCDANSIVKWKPRSKELQTVKLSVENTDNLTVTLVSPNDTIEIQVGAESRITKVGSKDKKAKYAKQISAATSRMRSRSAAWRNGSK